MRLVVQRVASASVSIGGEVHASISSGLLVLAGVARGDTRADAEQLAGKTARLRIFEDEGGKMNRSVMDTGGECLVISQFTLQGDCRKGNRPSFIQAAQPPEAIPLYEQYLTSLRAESVPVSSGEFGADMQVSLVNDGPVTLILESAGR